VSTKTRILRTAMILAVALTTARAALAVDDHQLSPEFRYHKAITQLERSGVLRAAVIPDDLLLGLDWVQKTALINLACQPSDQKDLHTRCLNLLKVSVEDQALVVRDHAWRKIAQNHLISREEKRQAAQRIVEDPRNYRRGRALWIVNGARQYLAR
jgi:hypothetical protein